MIPTTYQGPCCGEPDCSCEYQLGSQVVLVIIIIIILIDFFIIIVMITVNINHPQPLELQPSKATSSNPKQPCSYRLSTSPGSQVCPPFLQPPGPMMSRSWSTSWRCSYRPGMAALAVRPGSDLRSLRGPAPVPQVA